MKIADADNVRESTGYVIGGVPPFAHYPNVLVLLDTSLNRFENVWAAAGTPHSVMNVRVADLVGIMRTGFVELGK